MTTTKLPKGIVRYAVAAPAQTTKDGRTVRFVLSDSTVGRDGLTLATPGWELDNYRRNPVVLFGHDVSSVASVIGRMSNIATEGDQLLGDVEFAPPEINPMAETVLQMLRGGFLNAGSVGFRALAGRPTSDRNRPGGYDITRQELMEFSVVPVPALPTSLAEARRSGVDTAPIFRWAEKIMLMRAESEEWKVGAATDLPLDEDGKWDGPAAAGRMLDAAGFNGDSPDSAKARKGFLAYDAGNPTNKGSYKLPFADVVDGKLTAMKSGLDAAAQRLSQTDIPQAARDEAQKVIDGYKGKEKKGKGADARSVVPLKLGKRDMYGVACLALLLSDLGYIQDMTSWEAAFEEDDSPVPQMLTDCLKSLGTALVAMTVEEVTELVNGDDEDDDDALEFAIEVLAAKPDIRQTLIKTLRHIAHGRTVTMMVKEELVGTIRAGRVLSKANEDTLRGAHTQIRAACDDIMGVVNQVPADDTGPEDNDADRDAAPHLSRERALALVDVLKRK